VVRDSSGGWNTDYRIIDQTYHLCLAAKDAALGDYMPAAGADQVSKIVAVPCTADELQKWNAPPRPVPPALTDTAER
jgi:hypothetical protein